MSLPLRPALENVSSVDRALEDLLVRFIINCPPEDLSSVERELFHFEEASWFYTDFIKLLNPSLPSLKIKSFAQHIIRLCPLVWKWDIKADEALQKFSKYKKSIPVRGAAIFNEKLSKILLVQGTESDSWSFPRGKISKDEDDVACCIREVREEIGFDLTEYLDEDQFIERNIQGKNYKIFIVKGVPEDFDFKPQVRNEIEKIEWRDFKKMSKTMHKSNVKYYLVNSMMRPLSMWLRRQKHVKNDDQLKQYAEEQLKLLLGITREEQTDPGRDLLNMLHTAVQSKDEKIEPLQTLQNEAAANTVSQIGSQTIPIGSSPHQFPGMHPFAPFPYVNGSLPFMNPMMMAAPAVAPVPNHHNGFAQMNQPAANVSTPEPSSLAKPVLAQQQPQTSSNSRQLLDLLNARKNDTQPRSLRTQGSSGPADKAGEGANISDSQSLMNILKNPTVKQSQSEPHSEYRMQQPPPQVPEEEATLQDESADDGYEEFESDSQEEVEAENELEEEEEEAIEKVQSPEEPAVGFENHDVLKENIFKAEEVPHIDERSESAKSIDGVVQSAEKPKPKPKFKLLRRGENLEDILPGTKPMKEAKPASPSSSQESNRSPNSLLQLLKKPPSVSAPNEKKQSPEEEIMAMIQSHKKAEDSSNASAYNYDMVTNPASGHLSGGLEVKNVVNGTEPIGSAQSASADLLELLKRPKGVQNSEYVGNASSQEPAQSIPHGSDYAYGKQSSNELLNILHRQR
ncbi:hypothetical protein HG536_0D03170 [Torulaspora globosa]|uniref:Nudix hydrolase domain-containing protein n=1 Tax=Torulaspora globosa TaxID=48254 RepID=A0A7G3ZH09_9SACH|nr:uncharacterized protein HG536_0D03170 [Torulaspora globosa]QLL32795.1 hypothetical protein HG536_0D03170 [Torulaspora globosa]